MSILKLVRILIVFNLKIMFKKQVLKYINIFILVLTKIIYKIIITNVISSGHIID